MPLPFKRPGSAISTAASSTRKRQKSRSNFRMKTDPNGHDPDPNPDDLRAEFVALFDDRSDPRGVPNSALKSCFGNRYIKLVPIINDLTRRSRLNMSRVMIDGGEEIFYNLVSDAIAAKFQGLDASATMVYQVVEKAGTGGVWTKDIRTQTNIQGQALTKIFKALEARKLIKPVKCVTAKSKKLYMLYDLKPSREVTGGPWYTELEFDHEFINELRSFILLCVERSNGGKGVTLGDIASKMERANVSRVQLGAEDVQQIVQALAFDYMIETAGTDAKGEALFVRARGITTLCRFGWWETLSSDFLFREIKFEDDVVLAAHEPHHHTA